MKRKYGTKKNEWEKMELTGMFLKQLTSSTIFMSGVTLYVLLPEDTLGIIKMNLGGVYSNESKVIDRWRLQIFLSTPKGITICILHTCRREIF